MNTTDSETLYNLFESDDSNNLPKNEKIINKEELVKQKIYYKLLLSDYKKFIKKINYNSTTEKSFDRTNATTKSKRDKPDITDTIVNLYNNIKNIKKDLYYINEYFTNEILILDGENILKSYKYQQLLKQYISIEEYNKYFNYWNYGSSNSVVQPFTSLNLSVIDKIFLIECLIKNYLFSYNCIVMMSGKIELDIKTAPVLICDNKSIVIPIIYNKEDIREQDDHLLVYIYYHFNKIKNCKIISGDKFKWFEYTNNYLYNFVLEYDFNENIVKLNISNAYSNDLIIYKKYNYQVGYYYSPFITNIDKYKNLYDENEIDKYIFNNYELIISMIDDRQFDSITFLLINLFIKLIELHYEKNILFIKKIDDLLKFIISKLIHNNKPIFDELTNILNKIHLSNKKIFDNIDKYSFNILYEIIITKNNEISSMTDNVDTEITIDLEKINKVKLYIESYISITQIYQILKSMTFLLNNKCVIKISKLFSYIMRVYDKIEINIHKIRKISNNTTDMNSMFLNILSHHIFMKKNGYCKKDY